MSITAQTNLHGVKAADISAGDLSDGTVVLRLGNNVSVFINDTATVDALHEAATRMYEFMAEAMLASA